MNAVEPPYVNNVFPPEVVCKVNCEKLPQLRRAEIRTAVNTVPVVMVLAQDSPEVLIAHNPLDDDRVNPEPDVVAVKVAQVWVLQVPYERRHPVLVPLDCVTVMVDLAGTPVGVFKRLLVSRCLHLCS